MKFDALGGSGRQLGGFREAFGGILEALGGSWVAFGDIWDPLGPPQGLATEEARLKCLSVGPN